MFYSAWDGTDSGCDIVYGATTPDFIDFYDRHTFISSGAVTHVSNVNVQKMPDGSLRMLATAWPDANKMKKTICFLSPDGKIWNGSPEPYRAAHQPNASPLQKKLSGPEQNLPKNTWRNDPQSYDWFE